MATVQGIIAGISVNNSNKIEPDFDAMVYDYIINQDGHKLSFSTNDTILTVNGFAIADGIRGFFDNEQITIAANGYLYVLFTTHYNEAVADTVELEWSATALTETHNNIGSVAGIYRMKVLTIVNGSQTVNNEITGVLNAQNADVAQTVSTTIAAGATGTTPATTDNSTKVATTAFVNAAVQAKFDEITTTGFTAASNVTLSTNEVKKQGKTVIFNLYATITAPYLEANSPIATLPVYFRPASQISGLISWGDNITLDDGLYIGTDGVLRDTNRLNADLYGNQPKIKLFNIGFIAQT